MQYNDLFLFHTDKVWGDMIKILFAYKTYKKRVNINPHGYVYSMWIYKSQQRMDGNYLGHIFAAHG